MRRLLVVASLLLFSMAAAHAESFYFGGQRIHIGKRCFDISCLFGGRHQLRWPRHAWRHHGRKRGKAAAAVVASDPAVAPAETLAPESAAVAPEPLTSPGNTAAPPAPAAASVSKPKAVRDRFEEPLQPAAPAGVSPLPAEAPAAESKPAGAEAKPVEVAALPAEAEPPAQAATPIPLGNWRSREGMVSIEPCGANLCGYASDGRHAGAMVLINMRPSRKNTWVGRVHDFRSGGTYSARMTVRGPDTLRVEGCAFGGMVCDGRTLARIN